MLLLLILISSACTPQTTATVAPATNTPIPPTATPAPIPPTASPAPAQRPLIEITYDGTGCTVTGSDEVPTGRQTFLLNDLTKENVTLYVSILLEGHTYQDVLDPQSEPGVYYQKPSWVVYAVRRPPEWDGPVDGELHAFTLSEAGEYAIYVGSSIPSSLWFCRPLFVVQAPSE